MNQKSENNSASEPGHADGTRKGSAPEPPFSYVPEYKQPTQADDDSSSDTLSERMVNRGFDDALKLARIAQAMALVSIFIGGVMLATAAVVVSIVSYRRSTALEAQDSQNPDVFTLRLLRRTALVALIMSVIALLANALVFALIYPTVIEMLETGDYASVLDGVQPGSVSATGSDNSFWG